MVINFTGFGKESLGREMTVGSLFLISGTAEGRLSILCLYKKGVALGRLTT